ncbi:CAP domain-containing protein [Pseudoroseicyclus sp. H15]
MKTILSITALAALAACSSGSGGGSSTPPPGGNGGGSGGGDTPVATQQFQGSINSIRADNGRRAITADPLLNEAAGDYAEVLRAEGPTYISHTGPDGSTLGERLDAVGYEYAWAAENLAAGYNSNEAVLEGWMNSPGHRSNMLAPEAEEFGLGLEDRTWVLVLAAPAD